MKEVIFLLALGLVIGTACALIAGQWANALLFGLKAYDAVTFGCAAVLLTAVGGAAGYLPALRGSKVDAAKALRCD
ncbi:MAG: hypothetical protein JO108_33145 [Acidobacteriaceae bacterium]|nr:hypothetical protein [Acidobacteriaceae bacterium]